MDGAAAAAVRAGLGATPLDAVAAPVELAAAALPVLAAGADALLEGVMAVTVTGRENVWVFGMQGAGPGCGQDRERGGEDEDDGREVHLGGNEDVLVDRLGYC